MQEGLVEVFDYNDSLVQFTCKQPGHYNELASLYFNPWDNALRLLFHLPMVRLHRVVDNYTSKSIIRDQMLYLAGPSVYFCEDGTQLVEIMQSIDQM